MKKKILILGKSGLLGSNLFSGTYLKNYKIYSIGRDDVSDYKINFMKECEIFDVLDKIKPYAIINMVGLTDVDYCEQFPNKAYMVNVKILENLVYAISKLSFKPFLIHISTDQVYDGNGPFLENDVNLSNYYAFSKYCGELIARKTKSIILRTNFFGKSLISKRNSFSDWVYKSLTSENEFVVFEDIKFSPLSMVKICELLPNMIEEKIEGVFNLGSREGMSKADFADYFADKLNLKTSKMKKVKRSEVNFIKTYRPQDMRLNVSKFEKMFNIRLPKLTEEIKTIVKEYK